MYVYKSHLSAPASEGAPARGEERVIRRLGSGPINKRAKEANEVWPGLLSKAFPPPPPFKP